MLRSLVAFLSIFGLAIAAWSSPVYAATSDAGKLFQSNCAACHALGTNRINSQKTLKKADLEKWGMYDKAAIVHQVTNGKLAMPAFRGRLKSEQIEAVADYVLQQADLGWPRK